MRALHGIMQVPFCLSFTVVPESVVHAPGPLSLLRPLILLHSGDVLLAQARAENVGTGTLALLD